MTMDEPQGSIAIDWDMSMPADGHDITIVEPDGAKPSVIVRPVVNAIRIMRLLAIADKPLTAAQIASTLGINRSTCFNILKTLADERAIEFDRAGKTYFMTVGHQQWQAGLISEQQRLAAARRLMHALSNDYAVTVSLWKRQQEDRLTLVAVEHSPTAIRIHLTEGQRVPILMGASGRMMAVALGLSKKAIQENFRRLRWQRPVTFADYMDGVEQARRHGYGIDEGHFARGVTSIGVAVLDREGEPRFSATAIMFLGQYDGDTVEKIGAAMRRLGEELGQVLT